MFAVFARRKAFHVRLQITRNNALNFNKFHGNVSLNPGRISSHSNLNRACERLSLINVCTKKSISNTIANNALNFYKFHRNISEFWTHFFTLNELYPSIFITLKGVWLCKDLWLQMDGIAVNGPSGRMFIMVKISVQKVWKILPNG